MLTLIKKALRPWLYRLITIASRSYISGEKLKDALNTSDVLLKLGYSVTLGYWNREEEAPRDILSIYNDALGEINTNTNGNYLSIKAPAFHFDQDLYAILLKKARELHIPLHFDSLSHEETDAAFSLIGKNTQPPLKDIGCTLPGRWKRSITDAAWASDLGLNVRVVKGQWSDPNYPDIDMRS